MNRTALLLLAALGLLLSACNPTDEPAPAEDTVAATTGGFTRAVRVIAPDTGSLLTDRQATVTVEAQQESLVAAGTSGRLDTVVNGEGSMVAAGDIVLQLDDQQLRLQVDNARVAVESARVNLQRAQAATSEGAGQAQAGLQAAQLALQLQQRLFDEGQQLLEAGALSRSELTGLQAQLAQAEAAHRQAADAVNRSGRAGTEDIELLRLQLQGAETQLSQAEAQLAEASIRAPFDGTVVAILANPGEFVGAGQPAFRLSSSGPKLARFSVPTEDAALLAREPAITIEYGGLDYAAQLRPNSGVPAQGRLVSLTAEIYESENPIPSGAVARFSYQVELGSGDIVPSSAIRGGNTVLVVMDGVSEAVSISVIAEAGGRAIVTGLPEDAAVIHPLPADLMPGTAVELLD